VRVGERMVKNGGVGAPIRKGVDIAEDCHSIRRGSTTEKSVGCLSKGLWGANRKADRKAILRGYRLRENL